MSFELWRIITHHTTFPHPLVRRLLPPVPVQAPAGSCTVYSEAGRGGFDVFVRSPSIQQMPLCRAMEWDTKCDIFRTEEPDFPYQYPVTSARSPGPQLWSTHIHSRPHNPKGKWMSYPGAGDGTARLGFREQMQQPYL